MVRTRTRNHHIASALVTLAPALVFCVLLLGQAQQQQQPPEPARYLGVRGCRDCHGTRSSGDQYGIWLKDKHSSAYRTLLTPEAKEIAKREGIDDPAKSERCLKCHVTGAGLPADRFLPSFSPEEGVSCEACHGPGSKYRLRDVMDDRNMAYTQGLIKADEKVCIECHNPKSPSFKEFKYADGLEKIKHAIPEKGVLDSGGIAWLDSYDEGIKVAREKQMPIMLSFFYSKACPICEALATTLSDPAVVQESRNYVCVRLLDKPSEVHRGFSYWDVAIVFFAADGTEVKGMYGDYPPELLAHMMRRVPRVIRMRAELAQGATVPETTDIPWGRDGEFGYRSLLNEFDRHALECHGNEPDTAELLDRILAVGETGERALAEAMWAAPMRHPLTMPLAVEVLKSPARKGNESLLLDILSFLYDPDPHARHCAVTALGMAGDRKATSFITKYLLADSDERVMCAAFRALRQLKDPVCVDRMFEVMTSPSCCYLPQCPARIDAISVLYSLGDISVAPRLIEAAREDPLLQRAALGAFGEMGAKAVERGEIESKPLRESVSYLLEVAEDTGESFEHRNEAFYSLGKIGRDFLIADDPASGKPAVFGLFDPDPMKAPREGARSLGMRLARNLKEPNAELRATVCEICGWLRAFETIPVLLEVIESDESEIPRAFAGQALADLLLADGVSTTESEAPGKDTQQHRILADMRTRALAALDAMTGATSQLERSIAAESLARLGDLSYLAGLREAVAANTGTQPQDRKALAIACRALGNNGLASAVPAMVGILDPRDLDTTRLASIALQKLLGKGIAPLPAVVPADPPRIFFACGNAPSVAEERGWILIGVAGAITPWRRWLANNGETFMKSVEETDSPAPGKEEDGSDVAALDAEVISSGPETPRDGAAADEYHVWLKLTFRDKSGKPLRARGLLELCEAGKQDVEHGAAGRHWWQYDRDEKKPPVVVESAEPGHPRGCAETAEAEDTSGSASFSYAINRRCWQVVSHESAGWFSGVGMEQSAGGPLRFAHSWDGSLFLHLKSGFTEAGDVPEETRKLTVRFSARKRPLETTVEVP